MGTPFARLPESTRPRERLSAVGPGSLSETELLALQLRSGISGRSAADVAADLIAHFGGLRRLSAASVEELATVPGIGQAKAATLVAGFEVGRRVVRDRSSAVRLARASEVAEHAQRSLTGLRRERVLVLVCDRQARLLHEVQLSSGTSSRSLVDVREVLNATLRHDGSSFAVAHNHPSGDPTPSQADEDVTVRLTTAASAVGLRFLGHVVVTDDGWIEIPIRSTRRTID